MDILKISISKKKVVHSREIIVYLPFQEYLGDYPIDFYEQDLTALHDCKDCFKDYPIKTEYAGELLKTRVNFPLERLEERLKKAKRGLWAGYKESSGSNYFAARVTIEMPESITTAGKDITKSIFYTLTHDALVAYLYDLFVIANLACPGIFDFFKLSFEEIRRDEVLLLGIPWFRARLNCYNDALIFPVGVLPLKKVFKWYKTILPDYDLMPSSPAANALVSLLRYNSYDFEDPVDSLFLIHAIENLFGGNIPMSLIKKRISALVPRNNRIGKIVESLYDWRHKFIHGSLKLPHPLGGSEEFDKKYMQPYIDANESGFQLLLFSLQTLIKEYACAFKFEEVLSFEEANLHKKDI